MTLSHRIQMAVATALAIALMAAAFVLPRQRVEPPLVKNPEAARIAEMVRLEIERFKRAQKEAGEDKPPSPEEIALENQAKASSSPDKAFALIPTPPGSPPSLSPGERARIVLTEVAGTHPAEAVRWYGDHKEELPQGFRKAIRIAIIGAIAKTGALSEALSAMEQLERKSSPEAWNAIAANAPDAANWSQAFDLFEQVIAARPLYDRLRYLDIVLLGFRTSLRQYPAASAAPCLEKLEAAGRIPTWKTEK